MIDVNEYFDGKVKSFAFENSGKHQTLGLMMPGEYTFGTQEHEAMRVVVGRLTVRLPGSDDWRVVDAGQGFEVEGGETFEVRVESPSGYLCVYG